MIFVIPSFGRPHDQKTLRYLHSGGLGRHDIRIQVQTEQDYSLYSQLYSDFSVVNYDYAQTLGQNANNALKRLKTGKIVAVMDDDIRHAVFCEHGKRRKIEASTFIEKVESLKARMDSARANIACAYPSNGLSFRKASEKGTYSKNALGSGWLLLIRVGSVWYDPYLTSCEDYDIQLKEISSGGNIIRENDLAPETLNRTKKNGKQDGGRGFYYEDREHIKNIRDVARRYSPISKVSGKGTSILIDRRFL